MPLDRTDDESVWLAEVRRRLREMRVHRNLTQEQLAERAGLSLDAVARIERGNRSPGLASCRRLARALGVSLTELVEPTRDDDVRAPISGRLPDGSREVAVPVLGRIHAGPLHLANAHVEGWVSATQVRAHHQLFALRVRGESMTGAGINEGDLLIVRAQSTANDGDVVIARVDDEATVKRFVRAGEEIVLVAENPSIPPLRRRAADVEIQGIVMEVRRVIR